MNKINFIFDIGGVLIDFDLKGLQRHIANAAGISLEKVEDIWADISLSEVETGHITGIDYFKRYIQSILPGWTYDDWIKAWMDSYDINSNGRKLFLELRQKGSPVYILSNLAEYNEDAINKKFPDFFQASKENYFSFELGYHKPDIRIYLEVCRRIGAEPSKCIFLDDNEENVEEAKRAGLTGILFSDEGIVNIRKRIYTGDLRIE